MLKITLRELFLVVLVVALALGWWLDRKDLVFRTGNAIARANAAEVREKTAIWERKKTQEQIRNMYSDFLEQSETRNQALESLISDYRRLKALQQSKE